MTVGFQSWGANNAFVQIDSSYRGLRLTQQGQVTTDLVWGLGFIGNTVQGNYGYQNLTVNGQFPVVAIRAGTTTAVMTKRINDSSWTYTFITAGTGQPVQYWVFNELLPVPSNVGIQIFNPQGQVVFDGNDHPAKVMDFRQIGGVSGNGANYQEQLLVDYGRSDWAVCPLTFSTQTVYETTGLRRAILQNYGAITRGNQLFACRSISAMYNPGAGWGTLGSSSFYNIPFLTLDLARL